MAGANDVYNMQSNGLPNKVEPTIYKLSYCNVILCGIPFRRNIPLFHPINEEIININLFIYELSQAKSNVSVMDSTNLGDKWYDRSGIHLNCFGKKLLAANIYSQIIRKEKNSFQQMKISSDYHSLATDGSKNSTSFKENIKGQETSSSEYSIKVLSANMNTVIESFKREKMVAFSHCISSDIESERYMSAGVARIFGNKFTKPKPSHCVLSNLTFQEVEEGVYGLLTKNSYNVKPTKADCNKAFKQLTEAFTQKGFRKLICSPMECIRYEIEVEYFIENLFHFQQITRAEVDIITYEEHSVRVLRKDFLMLKW